MEDALMKMARSSELGIKVVDVRIKQINLPVKFPAPSISGCVPSGPQFAREHRSQGRERAGSCVPTSTAKVTVMIADAEK